MSGHSAYRFCLVTDEWSAHALGIAAALTEIGWAVHLLYCGNSPLREKQKFTVWCLNEGPAPIVDKSWTEAEQISGRIYEELNRLNQLYEFQLVEFCGKRALGFRSVQAKRCGVAFASTVLAVRAPVGPWRGNFSERFSFEQADLQVFPTRHRLTLLREQGALVKENARVVPFVLPAPELGPLAPAVDDKPELVFFAPSWLTETLPTPRIKVLGKIPRSEALAYLKQGNRLAIIHAPNDQYPFTMVDCAINWIPFLAANDEETKELVDSPSLARRLLFTPEPADLLRCLTRYLACAYTAKSLLRMEINERFLPEENLARLVGEYNGLTTLTFPPPAKDPSTPEKLSFAYFREMSLEKPRTGQRLVQEFKQALKAFRKIRN